MTLVLFQAVSKKHLQNWALAIKQNSHRAKAIKMFKEELKNF